MLRSVTALTLAMRRTWAADPRAQPSRRPPQYSLLKDPIEITRSARSKEAMGGGGVASVSASSDSVRSSTTVKSNRSASSAILSRSEAGSTVPVGLLKVGET